MKDRTLRHELAVYYDADGARQELRGEDLDDDINGACTTALEQSEEGRLLDWSEQIRLSVKPKSETARAHFFAPPTNQSSVFMDWGERNPAHDEHVRKLHARLTSRTMWTWEIGGMNLSDYQWRMEVARMLAPGVAARHDLFGHPAVLHSTPKRPSIAIEVINEHYPDKPVFTALMCLTEKLPVVVFFDVVEHGNKFLKVGEDGVLRPRFTMHGGKVWDYARETTIRTRLELKNAMEKVGNS